MAENQITRRSRADEVRPEPVETETILIADAPDASVISPEQALADAQKLLQQKDQDIAAERDRAQRAEAAARTANAHASQAGADHIGAREQALAGAVTNAETAKQSALVALKSAREVGNLDAELAAQDALADASADLKIAQAQKTAFAAAKAAMPQGTREADQPQGDAAEVAQWKREHPRFGNDTAYTQTAIAAHGAAIADGMREGSPAYFRYINDTLARAFDAGARQHDQTRTAVQQDTRRASSTAAPTSEGSRSSGGGTVQTMLGPVTVSADGKQIFIPPDIRPDFEAGAKINKMSLAAYAQDQIRIAQERANGGTGGMVSSDQVYR